MQLWLVRFLRRLRRSTILEVGRSSDHGHPHVRADTQRDHVPGDLFAKTDAGVETFCDDIDQTVVDGDLDTDVRVLGQQSAKRRLKHRSCCMLPGADANCTGRARSHFAERRESLLDFLEARPDHLQKSLPGLGWRYATGGARQETKPVPGLETLDRLAERGRREAKLGACARETALLGHQGKGGDLVETLGHL